MISNFKVRNFDLKYYSSIKSYIIKLNCKKKNFSTYYHILLIYNNKLTRNN